MPIADAYVRDGVLVARPQGTVDIGLQWLGGWFPLRLHHAVISLRLGAESPAPGTATQGVISGVLDTQEYVTLIDAHIADFCRATPAFCEEACDGPARDSILLQIQAASDIMKDGKQVPGATCDGISVGLGFEAVAVKLGPAVDQQTREPSPRSD